jgi:hypothetical protein
VRQLTAWTNSVEGSRDKGKRHFTEQFRIQRDTQRKAQDFRLNFLRNLKPSHPLFNSTEARAARGEEE